MAQSEEHRPAARAAAARYIVAVAAVLLGLALAYALDPSPEGRPSYAPLVGAVAVAVWYGGIGPALVATLGGWMLALWLLVLPRGELAVGGRNEMARWATSLGVGLVIVAMSVVLRESGRRAATTVEQVTADVQRLEALNEVAAALARAVSSSDVARALTHLGARLLEADGATVGLVEQDELALLESSGLAVRAIPTQRLPLSGSTLLAAALAEDRIVSATGRAELEARFPDTAVRMASVEAAIAVPLRAANEVVGVLGYVFSRESALGDEEAVFVETMAGLAQQAFERAQLYDRERTTRQALDRILRVAPAFRSDTAEGVSSAICREERSTFGADLGVLWQVRGGELHMIEVDPPNAVQGGFRSPLGDFPGLEVSVHELSPSFVGDILVEAHGKGLELMRDLGVRASLRMPISIRGQVERVLSLWWKTEVAEPDASLLLVVRRFADQAGLALEDMERRRAQHEAALRASEMRRLQSLSSALSNAVTRADVAEVAVEQIAEAMEADAVALLATTDDQRALHRIASRGLDGDDGELWKEVERDGQTPAALAVRSRRAHFYESRSDLVERFPHIASGFLPEEHACLLGLPLVSGRTANGVLLLSWRAARTLTSHETQYLQSLTTPVSQALDRAGLFESERTIAETLQRSILPAALPRVEGLQLAAQYLPGTSEVDVGGDWFDALRLPDGKVGLIVGDVVGKGVYAAASMGQLRNALRAFSVDRLKPGSALARLSRLSDDTLDTAFATIVYAAVDPETGACRIASAGHPPPLVVYPDGRAEFIESVRGLPLGTGIESRYRQELLELPAGAVLVLYTDGLVERRGRSIDVGLAELRQAALQAPGAPEQLVARIVDELVGDAERGDDVAILAARLLPVAPRKLDLRVPRRSGSLDLVRDALRAWLEGVSMSRSESEDVVLATWEACANAIEHPVEPADELVRVHATLVGPKIRVVIEDSGRWKPGTDRVDRGLGLQLIRSVASSLDVATANSGTRVTIERDILEASRPSA